MTELVIGARFELPLDPITLRDIVRYAGASGDFNPSHYDRELAVRSGFKTNFAQGMFTAGLLGVAVAERFGSERIRRFGVRFGAPLWCESAPVISGTVTSIDNDIARLDLAATVDGAEVMRGWADIALS
jgi:hypothetical protein